MPALLKPTPSPQSAFVSPSPPKPPPSPSPSPTMSHSTYPTRSAGPARPTRPLQRDLIQIIPGNPRDQSPAVTGLPSNPIKSYLHLFAELDNHSASIDLTNHHSSFPDLLFQFHPDDVFNSAVTFTLLQTATSDLNSLQLASPLFAKIQTRKLMSFGSTQLLLVDSSGLSPAHLTISHFFITAHDTGAVLPPRVIPEAPRFTGHRGQGGNKPAFPYRVLENSLESFLMVGLPEGPVKTVELDVQLTKDGKPVIFHNWFFTPTQKNGLPERKVAVYDVTFDEFDHLLREEYAEGGDVILSERRKALREMVGNRSDVSEDVFGYRALSLLEVCEQLPEEIGLLVEVKFPPPNIQSKKSLPFPERNQLLDAVLDDLFASVRNTKRKISMLCFEADCCLMLSLKQNIYPVYFSHCEELDVQCDDADPRCLFVEEGLRFAEAHNFHGMMIFNEILAQRPHVARVIRESGLSLLTYGVKNSDPDFVQQEFEWGVNGVISDDVDLVVNKLEEANLR